MNNPIVQLDNIGSQFGHRIIHEHLFLRVTKGEIVSLIGGSGSGKTTLFRYIIGLSNPTHGDVKLFGEPVFSGTIEEIQNRRRRFGVLFQQGALFSALTVAENIAFPLRERRIATEREIQALVAMKMAMVELKPEHAELLPAELSGGMIKRVALARSLALEPELLLLDEPTAGLDPKLSAEFVRLIAILHSMLNLTVILITHDAQTVSDLSTKVAVLAEKKIISYASVSETKKLTHPFVQSFFTH